MLTVRDDEEDIVESLDAGAFDYVTKPFQIRELTARLRGVIRRRHAPIGDPDMVSIVGDITLDANRRLVEKKGERIHLAPKEYETLRCLMEHAGINPSGTKICTDPFKDQITAMNVNIWCVMSSIAKKIEDDPCSTRLYLDREPYRLSLS